MRAQINHSNRKLTGFKWRLSNGLLGIDQKVGSS